MPAESLPEVYTVHPAADVYPMIDGEQLNQLADDIKANGQIDPIIFTTVDDEPVLIDGRNRLAACSIAEVHPVIDWQDFDDDTAIRTFILSKNENRRHLNAGQRAMCVARIVPEAATLKRKGSDVSNCNISKRDLSQARLINRWASDLVDSVISADTKFSDALKQAKQNRMEAESRKTRLDNLPPDLRTRVVDGELDLREAEAIYRSLIEDAKNDRATHFNALANAATYLQAWSHEDLTAQADAFYEYPDEFRLLGRPADIRNTLVDMINNAQRMLSAYDQKSK